MASTSNHNNLVKILEVRRVTPNSATEFTLPLTFFDTLWFKFHPVERVYFYQVAEANPSYFNSVILPNLTDSLSQTLAHFLPLAGALEWPEQAPVPAVHYAAPNGGVWLTVADSVDPTCFTRISGKNPVPIAESRACVPPLHITDSEAAVVALQVTLFSGHGFSIGVTSHHAVLDGKSATMFVKAWAHFSKILLPHIASPSWPLSLSQSPLPPELTPSFDREVVNDPDGICSEYLNTWVEATKSISGSVNPRSLKLLPLTVVPGADPLSLVRATYEMSRDDIGKLREKISSLLGGPERTQQHLTSFVLAFSHTLVCMFKSKEPDSSRKVALAFTADCRRRMDPPVPENYFGNCVTFYFSIVGDEDLRGEDGVVVVAQGLNELKRELESGGVLQGAKGKVAEIFEVTAITTYAIGVAGSTRFGVYGSDFGWGRPRKVEVTSIDRTGAVSMAESRDGSGGIELGVVLGKHQMEVFHSLFVSGLS